jgi:hypothetical protein
MAKKLRCRLGFHRWADFRSEDGEPYRKCRDCGKFLDTAPQMGNLGG